MADQRFADGRKHGVPHRRHAIVGQVGVVSIGEHHDYQAPLGIHGELSAGEPAVADASIVKTRNVLEPMGPETEALAPMDLITSELSKSSLGEEAPSAVTTTVDQGLTVDRNIAGGAEHASMASDTAAGVCAVAVVTSPSSVCRRQPVKSSTPRLPRIGYGTPVEIMLRS